MSFDITVEEARKITKGYSLAKKVLRDINDSIRAAAENGNSVASFEYQTIVDGYRTDELHADWKDSIIPVLSDYGFEVKLFQSRNQDPQIVRIIVEW